MTASTNVMGVSPFLAASLAIGVADNSAFFFFKMELLGGAGSHWMLGALLSRIALFLVGAHYVGFRALWLLLGLPLVLLPFALAGVAAGQI